MSKWLLGLALFCTAGCARESATETRSVSKSGRSETPVIYEARETSVLPGTVMPPAGGVIAFDSNWEGNWEVYVMDDNGRNIRRITSDPAFDTFPAISPDGKSILWQSNRLPKGKNPAVVHYDLYVADINGKNLRNVTNTPGSSEGHACWSPDGKKIAFTYAQEGADRNNGHLAVINTDGTDLKHITEGPVDGVPHWSPDGEWIVFDSARDGNHEIYKVKPDGSKPTRLTNHPALDSFPVWSPDGKAVAFFSERGGKEISELYLMDAEGKTVRKIADGHAIWPSWSPDGKRLTFMSARNGGWDVFTIGSDGSGLDQLTNLRSLERHPSWGRLPQEPPLAPGQVKLVSTVTGMEWVPSTPEKPAFNPQKYLMGFQGKVILEKSDIDALKKGGTIADELAKKVVTVFSDPEYAPTVKDVTMSVKQGKIEGKFSMLSVGVNGTHKRTFAATMSGSVSDSGVHLKASDIEVGGSWQWGATEENAAPLTGVVVMEAMTVR